MSRTLVKSLVSLVLTLGLAALSASPGLRLCHAFEIRKIPSLQNNESLAQKFKQLSPEQQQVILDRYRQDQKAAKTESERISSETSKVVEKQGIEQEKLILETKAPQKDTAGAEKPVAEVSKFEEFVAGKLAADISRNVRQFGYDLFVEPPSTFAPPRAAPVTSSYVIGPDDEIKISLWGKVEKELIATVDRDGNIALPSVGVLHLAGLTFQELKGFLRKEFKKYFSDFYMNVTMGRLRTIKIFVVGCARSPGSYDVSGQCTLINALFVTGGPSKTGSLRKIKVMRNNAEIVQLDLYDFIMKGDKSADVTLEPGDVVFMPPTGALVAVVGNVKVPAIYELRGPARILDLLNMAGGVLATGYLHRVQVERVVENQFKGVIDKNLTDIKDEDNIALQDGDIVKVFPISETIVNAVNLKGNVVRPGMYEWVEGLRVSHIVKSEDLLPDTLYDFAKIERLTPPYYETTLIHFDLEKALSGDPKEDRVLEPYDTITVYNKWQLQEKPLVRIAGAVNMAGEYEYTKGMKVSDIIRLAGGLKKYAYEKAEFTRIFITQNGPVTERTTIDIREGKDGLPKDNLALQEDDYLFIRPVPDWHLYRQVKVAGEVVFPGTYTIKKGEHLADVLERAGGFTEDVYLKGAVFTRKSVQEAQQKTLEQSVDRLEQEFLSAAAAKTASAFSEEEAKILETQTRQYQELIRRLRTLKAMGRLVISMAPLSVLRHTPSNVELEDGDEVFIPSKMSTINVMGSVYNPSSYIYDTETKAGSYVDMAGGPTDNADADRTYVIKVDGSALSSKKLKGSFFGWNNKTYRWEVGNLSKTKLDPGDTIIVPEKFDRLALMRNIKDITQIMFQLAVVAGVLVAL